jgi:hypothetical protein
LFKATHYLTKDEFENIWLTQKMMNTPYSVEAHTVNYHLKKVFADSELDESSVIRKFRITATEKVFWSYYTTNSG